jgi:hypothetical protein
VCVCVCVCVTMKFLKSTDRTGNNDHKRIARFRGDIMGTGHVVN